MSNWRFYGEPVHFLAQEGSFSAISHYVFNECRPKTVFYSIATFAVRMAPVSRIYPHPPRCWHASLCPCEQVEAWQADHRAGNWRAWMYGTESRATRTQSSQRPGSRLIYPYCSHLPSSSPGCLVGSWSLFRNDKNGPNQSRKCAINNFWTKDSAGQLGATPTYLC